MNRNRIYFTVFLTLIVLFVFTFNVFGANETTNEVSNATNDTNSTNEVRPLTLSEQKDQVNEAINNANERLTYVSGELSDTAIEIQNLNDKITKYKQDAEKVTEEYNKYAKEVSDTENKIKVIQDKYNKQYELFKKRMVALYKKGNMSYMDVLFSSTNVVDFVSNYFIVKQIAEFDSNNLDELANYKTDLENENNKLNNQKAELKKLKDEADTQTVLMENAQVLVKNYLKSLSNSEQELIAEINTYKLQQQEIEGLISNALINSTYELQYVGGIMAWPTYASNYITSPFGSRLHPIQGVVKNHDGIDIGGHMGDSVYAAADGLVIYAAWLGGYGNAVMIDHGLTSDGKRLVTLYGHGQSFVANIGDQVTKGQEIMKMGSTGNSTGPHVHFEVREDNSPVDPKKYLSANYVDPASLNLVDTNIITNNVATNTSN